MRQVIAISSCSLTLLTGFGSFVSPARASFGDFMLGVGAGVGTSVLINNARQDTRNRYRPVSPEDEFFRGVQDGVNGARYDNPRNSIDYDRGFQEGLRRRNQGR